MILLNSRLIVVDVRRHSAFHLKKVVSVPIDLVFRGCRQAHHLGIEVLEDRFILFEDGSMGLVNDNKIEMRGCVETITPVALNVVNGIEN